MYLLEFHFPYTKETVPKTLVESQKLLNHIVRFLQIELCRGRLDKHIIIVTSVSGYRDDIPIIGREIEVIMFIHQFKKQYCLQMSH